MGRTNSELDVFGLPMDTREIMSRSEATRSAVEILHRRYVGDDPERLASLQRERARMKVARKVYDLRTRAGLTQLRLATKLGVAESVIRRLEDADY